MCTFSLETIEIAVKKYFVYETTDMKPKVTVRSSQHSVFERSGPLSSTSILIHYKLIILNIQSF
jgi:hypothetical protein